MPKSGFKSFSLKEGIYDEFFSKYVKNKEILELKGIHSFSGYIAYILNSAIKNHIVLKNSPFEKIYHDTTTVTIKDKQKNKIIEISIMKNQLFCRNDNSNNCVHVGFAYSIPEVIELIHNDKTT